MDANNFVAKLKADGSANDSYDLDNVFNEYKVICDKLSSKDRGSFSLNVLCILSRNIDKVPCWASKVDNKALLKLSIDCIRETRCLETADRVKTLACIYHLHKYVVKQTVPIPPELVLKISYMPFEDEADNLLKDYCKTYWNILVDRLFYLEQLKPKVPILKLLSKFTEDLLKVIHIYNSVQFCTNILVFLLKKLHFLYSDITPTQLNEVFGKIFESISKKNDFKMFKKLSDKESMDLYVKLNDCLYVIADNSSKINFQGSVFSNVVCTSISMLGHFQDKMHCFQTFYSNVFCSILTDQPNVTFIETILNSLPISCEAAEKLGYKKTMYVTYPYLNQLLRLYIEYFVTNSPNEWKVNFNVQIQESCLKLILFLMKKLKYCEQLLRCENCKAKSGLHDSLRLSFLIKHFISVSVEHEFEMSRILPAYYLIIQKQYEILTLLCSIGCVNYVKCYRKLQADIHNSAISLNKSKYYEHSTKLFDIYLKNEIKHFKDENDLKNISRALYNKSICELDNKLHENALKTAYLSMLFAQPDGLNTEKYMSLVMDIKAKVIKYIAEEDLEDEEDQDKLQLMTVFDACEMWADDAVYGNLKPFFCNLKFSTLLKHEFDMYVRLWPSIVPIAGVCRSLYEMSKGKKLSWNIVKDDEVVQTLLEVVLQTPAAVRMIHSVHYAKVVKDLLWDLHDNPPQTPQLKVIEATLLLLQTEFDLHEASQKYGWKPAEPSMDPDNIEAVRTVPQEFTAAGSAIRAVGLWTDIIKELKTVPKTTILHNALRIAQVFVRQLLHLSLTAQALQLAHVCCKVAQYVGDKDILARNAGVIISHGNKKAGELADMIALVTSSWSELVANKDTLETALVFLCDCAIYYNNIGLLSVAARIVQRVQIQILTAYEKYPNINLELAVGRLMEAQVPMCTSGPTVLSGVNGIHRHYLATPNTATKWCSRRLYSMTLKQHMSSSGLNAARVPRALLAWKRARVSAGAAIPFSGAIRQARVYATIINTHLFECAQTKIDNRMKQILGLQPNEAQPCYKVKVSKIPTLKAKRNVETMLEHNITFKKTQTSPSCVSVPAFIMPEFLTHDSCQCHNCQIPDCQILACQACGLEASMYFRAKEFDIARNYFDGAMKCFGVAEAKLKTIYKKLRNNIEKYIVDIMEVNCDNEFKKAQIDFLIEASFFELSQGNFKNANENIITINEMLQENKNIDPYVKNEVLNLMLATAQLRNVKKTTEINLEVEFEAMRLSPNKNVEPPKTPEAKAEMPPKLPKIVVKDEEIPTKRRVIKLNLEEDSEENPKKTTKKTFKIPEPVNIKPILEAATPVVSKPNILLTQPSEDSIFDFATPKPNVTNNEFATPLETPEQFFTPMTSVKTYSKSKNLRHGIVKNLENEFSTPKVENKDHNPKSKAEITRNDDPKLKKVETNKENDPKLKKVEIDKENDPKLKKKVEKGSLKTIRDKRMLKRATSPGKLSKEEKPTTRSRRLREPVKFSLDEDK